MEEEKERERDQRDGAGLKWRRKGDDRSRTASSVLTGAVRSVRERERETQRGREQESGRGDGGEGREKENEWRERCSEQRRRAHRNSRAITHEDRRSLARSLVACARRPTHDGGSTTSPLAGLCRVEVTGGGDMWLRTLASSRPVSDGFRVSIPVSALYMPHLRGLVFFHAHGT